MTDGFFVAVALMGVAVVIFLLAEAHAKRARRLAAQSVGLAVEGDVARGTYRERAVEVRWSQSSGKSGSQWTEVAAALGRSWPAGLGFRRNLLGSTVVDGGDPETRRLLRESPLAFAASSFLSDHPRSRVEGGMLAVRVPRWVNTADWLRMNLDTAVERAERLERAFSEAMTQEQREREEWKASLEAIGLSADASVIAGIWRDVDVRIELAVDDDGSTPRLVAPLGPGLPKGLVVRRASLSDKLPFGHGRLLLEDEALDALLHVECEEPERAAHLFRHADVREAFSRLFGRREDSVLRDGRLFLELPRGRLSATEISVRLDEVRPLVYAIQKHTDWPEKRDAVARRRRTPGA